MAGFDNKAAELFYPLSQNVDSFLFPFTCERADTTRLRLRQDSKDRYTIQHVFKGEISIKRWSEA
jgi:hypothetical protein